MPPPEAPKSKKPVAKERKKKGKRAAPLPPKATSTTSPWRCPCCEGPLIQAEVQTYRDPITDASETQTLWRCGSCLWRQAKVTQDSEWSHTPPVERPVGDLGEDFRIHLEHHLKGMVAKRKRTVPMKTRRLLVEELRNLLDTERWIDEQLVGGEPKRRVLTSDEAWLVTMALPAIHDLYGGARASGTIRAHWDETIRQQFKAGWPDERLLKFARKYEEWDASFNIRVQRCAKCLLVLRKTNEWIDYCGVSTPNPIDLRDERVTEYICDKCGKSVTHREDA